MSKSSSKNTSSEASRYLMPLISIVLVLLSTLAFLGLILPEGDVSGAVGAAFSDLFGRSAWLAILALLVLSCAALISSFSRFEILRANYVLGAALLLVAISGIAHVVSGVEADRSALSNIGGVVGWAVGWNLTRAVTDIGAMIVLLAIVFGVVSLFSIRHPILIKLVSIVGAWALVGIRRTWHIFGANLRKVSSRSVAQEGSDELSKQSSQADSPKMPDSKSEDVGPDPNWQQDTLIRIKTAEKIVPVETPAQREADGWTLPSFDILEAPVDGARVSEDEISRDAELIEQTLSNFNVKARVVEAIPGPVVTQFCLAPAPGVKVSSINNLSNDLALALSANAIRVEAPIPGRPYVGIEFPNRSPAVVTLREVFESPAYTSLDEPLKLVMGKNVADDPQIRSLASMPHLLIAGATGAGKSVFLNSLLMSLMFQHTPEELRLILIDPKMVELVVYNELPHLKMPVVTKPADVVPVLAWASQEMTRRYRVLSDAGHRNITTYNQAAVESDFEKFPFLVIVIDELADLMMSAPAEVERYICRLAQMARAVGIHLVIATQRPSVDIVTGLIKANFPTRVAFMVSSQFDSRTILDSAGAEKLVGRGDMLFASSDSGKLTRIQGAYASDEEIRSTVQHWAGYDDHLDHIGEDEINEALEASLTPEEELYEEAEELIRKYSYASAPLLQRELKIGNSMATRILDRLEEAGVIGAAVDGNPSREVISEENIVGELESDEDQ